MPYRCSHKILTYVHSIIRRPFYPPYQAPFPLSPESHEIALFVYPPHPELHQAFRCSFQPPPNPANLAISTAKKSRKCVNRDLEIISSSLSNYASGLSFTTKEHPDLLGYLQVVAVFGTALLSLSLYNSFFLVQFLILNSLLPSLFFLSHSLLLCFCGF